MPSCGSQLLTLPLQAPTQLFAVNHLAVADHRPDCTSVADVLQGIAVEYDQIGSLANGDLTDLILEPENLSGSRSCRGNSLGRGEARLD